MITTTPPTTARAAAPSDRMRKAALWAGVMYLLTFVSIPTLALYGPVKEAGFVTGLGSDSGVLLGGALELVVGLTCIGTAVALYPVVRRQNEALAMGFVGARILEGTLIFVGVASLWTLMALRQGGAGAEAALMGEILVAFYDKVFLVSQGLIPTFNALLLGTLLYRSQLVPRVLPVLGFIGAGTLLTYNTAALLGFSGELAEVLALVMVLPIATWEFSLGVYLVVKGFRPAAVARLDTVPATPGSPWPGLHAPPHGLVR
ncbi:DUF4386 domain-containing protein [Ornithinimicrobium sp. F0845]|uniref:DUF4386 domain-containing protein n=1 Tax=Ornithinimicrobium sp. F0845 TaxID=2926412 RepID=UPI001FF1D3CD|nr:DUF4386 domain-containing protein [Ornithinimicrobium sp. F0845]MCK0112582.1 DUF4386 domain-containing protein [Ornithinimicrobium sp. F0845]